MGNDVYLGFERQEPHGFPFYSIGQAFCIFEDGMVEPSPTIIGMDAKGSMIQQLKNDVDNSADD